MPNPIILDLPIPPSTNNIWRQGKQHVYINPVYAAWKKQADATVIIVGLTTLGRIEGRFTVLIQINESMVRSNRDLDNFTKVLLDYCRRIELVKDDNLKLCRSVTVRIDEETPPPLGCRVTLTPL